MSVEKPFVIVRVLPTAKEYVWSMDEDKLKKGRATSSAMPCGTVWSLISRKLGVDWETEFTKGYRLKITLEKEDV